MTTIGNLGGVDVVNDGDLIPVFKQANRRTRNVSARDLAAYVNEGADVGLRGELADPLRGARLVSYGGGSVYDGLESLDGFTGGACRCAAGQLMSKLSSGIGGTILVVSDSTGNETTEWVYRLAQKLADENSSIQVNYYLWNVASNDYSSPVVIGSGAIVVSLYNAAVSGSRPDYFYGSRFSTMVEGFSALDLVIINHGHNLITQSADVDTLRKRTPQLLELPAMLLRKYEGFGLVYVAQNPRRDDNSYEPVYRAIVESAGLTGADLADVYSEFIKAGKPASFYNDNIHPSFEGQTLFLDKIHKLFRPAAHGALKGFIQAGGQNLLPNGDFVIYGAGGPAGFTLSGVTAEKETTIKETGDYSIKLTSASLGQLTSMAVDVPNLKDFANSVVTLAVRVFVPTINADTSSGRIGLLTPSNNTNNTAGNSGKGGWHWRFVSVGVAQSDTYLRAIVYAGSASTPGSVVYIDRMILCRGRLAYDNFPKTQNIIGFESVGDASVSFSPGANYGNLVYDTPLSTSRTATLEVAGASAGDKVRIVRTLNSTGDTLTNPATGKSIGVGEWCDFLFTGAAWIVAAAGSL
jgi:hypothetical protein